MRRASACYLIVLVVLPWGLGCAEQKEELAVSLPDEPTISPMTYFAAAQVLEHQRDLMGAIYQYSKAIDAEPRLTRAYNRLGLIFQKLNRIDDAQLILKQGIEENPECAILRNNFGFCCLQKNNYAGAEQQFRSALELSPKFSQAWMNLGIALARQARFGESVAAFQQVVPPEVAYTNVASVCVDMEDYEHAAWALRNALANDPEYGPAKDQVERVTSLARAARKKARTAQGNGGWASLVSYQADAQDDAGASILTPPLGSAQFSDGLEFGPQPAEEESSADADS